MGEMSEMMLGISACDLFERDLCHAIRNEPFEENPENPKYLPTDKDLDINKCYTFTTIQPQLSKNYNNNNNSPTYKQKSYATAIAKKLNVNLPIPATKESYREFISKHIDNYYKHNIVSEAHTYTQKEVMEMFASLKSELEEYRLDYIGTEDELTQAFAKGLEIGCCFIQQKINALKEPSNDD